jgi:hypothetical protein
MRVFPSSGTTIWKPLEPDVLAHDWRPISSSRVRSPSAAERNTLGSSSEGSRSNTHRSGWYNSGAREVHTCGVMQFWLAIHSSERSSFTSG